VASRVVLEITEHTSLDDIADVRERVARLRSVGFRIAVDDLGAGYAGLNSFAQLQPEVVKLDIALVRDIHLEPTKRALAESMTSLCRQMHVAVVAEGDTWYYGCPVRALRVASTSTRRCSSRRPRSRSSSSRVSQSRGRHLLIFIYIDIHLFKAHLPGVTRRLAIVGRALACCVPRPRLRPKATLPYAALFRALGDETRLEILGLLAVAGDGLCACEIENHVKHLSQPTISHHLRQLREAGLVTAERRGTWIYYALDRAAVARLGQFAELLGA
jgi:DNA-binding transcriptional ArsR family regulator